MSMARGQIGFVSGLDQLDRDQGEKHPLACGRIRFVGQARAPGRGGPF